MNNGQKLLDEIRALSFVLTETQLYLDSYPDNRDALAYFRKIRKELAEKTAVYEDSYGPLTPLSSKAEENWDWVSGPWPWESED